MANSPSGETIVERVFRILAAFDGDRLSMTVAELGRRAELPSTTCHRLVDELLTMGLLERRDDGIMLGVKLWELTERSSWTFVLRETARPHLEALRDALDQHVVLGVLDRHDVLYVDRLPTEKSTLNITKIAARLGAHASSAGQALMAYAQPEIQNAFLNARFRRYTSRTVTDAKSMRNLLAQIRQRGYAVSIGAVVEPSSGIAVPIRNADGRVISSVGLVVPVGEERLTSTIPAMQETAAAITRELPLLRSAKR